VTLRTERFSPFLIFLLASLSVIGHLLQKKSREKFPGFSEKQLLVSIYHCTSVG
jgi:hypothetical protein